MPEKYPIPAAETEVELTVINSRFIASIAAVFSVDNARAFIKSMRTRYPDATHHVPAYLIGHGTATTAHCSDDGEPSGTAGRPALAVLQGSGLGDVVVVVTRYFGGTRLGKGGLVRAYSDAVRQVLKAVPLAYKVPTLTVRLTLPYSLYEQVMLLVDKHNGELQEKDFAAEVTLIIRFSEENYPAFEVDLTRLTHARYTPEILERNPETIIRNSSKLVAGSS